jgi:nitroreductase
MNSIIQQAILDRRSIRNFRPDALTEEQLDALADAALASPSAMDLQPWQFSFVLDPAVHRLLTEATLEAFRAEGNQSAVDRITGRHESLFYGAPLVIVISTPDASSMIDAGIAVQTLALAAHGLGLGSCIIGLAAAAFSGPSAATCRGAVGMATDRIFAICVAIGHPAVTKGPHERHCEKIVWIREAP